MTTDKFFDILSKLYMPKRNDFLVKFYCQESTFSWEIYTEDAAFHGKTIYQSEVYYFWRSCKKEIIRDIKTKLKELRTAKLLSLLTKEHQIHLL